MKKFWRKFGKIAAICFASIIGIVLIYLAYVWFSYHRIPDRQTLDIDAPFSGSTLGEISADNEYSIMTYNIGFGAYSPDFSFFMDGGKQSWAKNRESVYTNIKTALKTMQQYEPDFLLIEEIDLDSTRSYHINQYKLLREALWNYQSCDAVNYDSAFLMYPLYQPHGKSNSSLGLFSKYDMSSATRRSLPMPKGFGKLLDLDRCYIVSRFPVSNGKELIIYTLHLSAYGTDDSVRNAQIAMLFDDMEKEYEAGNYVIAGGDFNHDLLLSEDKADDCPTWAYPFPRSKLPANFMLAMDYLSTDELNTLWNSARNDDIPYDPAKTTTFTLDGFIISDNVTMKTYQNINTGYAASDHDPVYMTFILN